MALGPTLAQIFRRVFSGADNSLQVKVVSGTISNPTGAATLAEQQTQTTHLSNSAASLGVLDDWDESDRAKVNIIAGQAGVAGGSGAVGATTQRVVLATDVPLPAGTNTIGAANQGTPLSSGAGWRNTEYGPNGLPNVYWNVGPGVAEVPSVVIGDPIAATAASVSSAGGLHTNLAQIGANTISAGNGVSGTGVQRVTLASDSTGNIATIGTSIVPGTGATNLGKANNAPAGATDTGVAVLGTRNDTNAATAGTDGDYGHINLDSSGAQKIIGKVAHGTAADSRPVAQGFEARTTNPTAVSDGQTVRAQADDLGRQVVVMNQVRDLVTDATTTITSSTSETTILAAAASTFHDVTMLSLFNTSQTATRVDIRDTTAGSVRFSVYLVPGGGVVMPFNVPLKQATVNTNWTAQCGTSVDGVRIHVQAVKNV